MLQVVVGGMTNYAFFVTDLPPFFCVSVIWVAPYICFTGVPREFKKHILRREGISASVLTQEAMFEFPTGAWFPAM